MWFRFRQSSKNRRASRPRSPRMPGVTGIAISVVISSRARTGIQPSEDPGMSGTGLPWRSPNAVSSADGESARRCRSAHPCRDTPVPENHTAVPGSVVYPGHCPFPAPQRRWQAHWHPKSSLTNRYFYALHEQNICFVLDKKIFAAILGLNGSALPAQPLEYSKPEKRL